MSLGIHTHKKRSEIHYLILKINGYPYGWYYQGQLIYPADAAGFGAIVNSIGGNVKIENNTISL
jgi:hypothetical protein